MRRQSLITAVLLALALVATAGRAVAESASRKLDGAWAAAWTTGDGRVRPGSWEEVGPGALPEGRGGRSVVWWKTALPSGDWEDPSLYIPGIDELFEVYVDGERIYAYGDLDGTKAFAGWPWHIVPLKPAHLGHTVYFRVLSQTDVIGMTGLPEVGERLGHVRTFVRGHIEKFAAGVLILFVGAACLLTLAARFRIPLFWQFGLLAVTSGFFQICYSRFGLLFYEAPTFWLVGDRLSLMLIPLCLLVFIEFGIKGRPGRIGWTLGALHLAYFLTAAVLIALDSRWTNGLLRPFQKLHLVTLVYAITGNAMRAWKGDVDSRLFLLGILASVLLGIHDTFVSFQLGPFRYSRDMAQWGFLLTNLCFMLILARRVVVTNRDKQRMEAGLLAANAVQAALLPEQVGCPNLDVSHHYQAAEQTGGDWYTCYHDPKMDRFYAIIGDVTGHGVASALVTAAVAGTVEATYNRLLELGGDVSLRESVEMIARTVNYAVYKTGRRTERLMTMAFIGIDVATGKVFYLNAGHTELYLARGAAVQRILARGDPLGMDRDLLSGSGELALVDQDCLFLYTDGLVENQGPDGKIFQKPSLQKLLAHASRDLDGTAKRILAAGQSIWRETPPYDDVAFVLLRWRQPAAAEKSAA